MVVLLMEHRKLSQHFRHNIDHFSIRKEAVRTYDIHVMTNTSNIFKILISIIAGDNEEPGITGGRTCPRVSCNNITQSTECISCLCTHLVIQDYTHKGTHMVTQVYNNNYIRVHT